MTRPALDVLRTCQGVQPALHEPTAGRFTVPQRHGQANKAISARSRGPLGRYVQRRGSPVLRCLTLHRDRIMEPRRTAARRA